MKFKVILGWRSEYLFDDIEVAANFAVTALKASRNSDESDSVKIELVKEEGEEIEE